MAMQQAATQVAATSVNACCLRMVTYHRRTKLEDTSDATAKENLDTNEDRIVVAVHQSYWQTVRRDNDGRMIAAAMGRSDDHLVKLKKQEKRGR
jgi:hypothetical protein